MQKTWMRVVWPAFLAACALEMLVFGLCDPHDMHFFGSAQPLSNQALYTLGFAGFWAISAAACWMTVVLGRSSAQINDQA